VTPSNSVQYFYVSNRIFLRQEPVLVGEERTGQYPRGHYGGQEADAPGKLAGQRQL
jgi:hypothetical protein